MRAAAAETFSFRRRRRREKFHLRHPLRAHFATTLRLLLHLIFISHPTRSVIHPEKCIHAWLSH
jgi:hypothetical protein